MADDGKTTFDTTTTAGSGGASGWATWPAATERGKWAWSAYGPRGSRFGSEGSRQDAQAKAQAAVDELTSPVET